MRYEISIGTVKPNSWREDGTVAEYMATGQFDLVGGNAVRSRYEGETAEEAISEHYRQAGESVEFSDEACLGCPSWGECFLVEDSRGTKWLMVASACNEFDCCECGDDIDENEAIDAGPVGHICAACLRANTNISAGEPKANGDVFLSGHYVGRVDSDGDVIAPTEERKELVREIVRAAFDDRASGSWPELKDWPIDVLKCIADDVDQDWSKGQTRLTIDGHVYVFEGMDAWEEEENHEG